MSLVGWFTNHTPARNSLLCAANPSFICVLCADTDCLQDTPAFEVLYQENSILNQKLTEKRAAREAETSKQCTFTPHLVSQQLVKEGRVMKVGVGREGEGVCAFGEGRGGCSMRRL